jgi:hypothetical protein
MYQAADKSHVVGLMSSNLEELKGVHNGLFLGFEQLRRLANDKMHSLKVGAPRCGDVPDIVWMLTSCALLPSNAQTHIYDLPASLWQAACLE